MTIAANEESGKGPLANVIRSVYYDDRREPFYTVYQPLPAVLPQIGSPAQVAVREALPEPAVLSGGIAVSADCASDFARCEVPGERHVSQARDGIGDRRHAA